MLEKERERGREGELVMLKNIFCCVRERLDMKRSHPSSTVTILSCAVELPSPDSPVIEESPSMPESHLHIAVKEGHGNSVR